MAKNEKQKMRFSEEELSVIKTTFAENDELIRAIRKTFLQYPLDAIDKAAVSGFKSKEVLAVIRKTFLPTLDINAPLHQLIDLWLTLKVDDKTPESTVPHIMARELLIKYLDQQLQVLEGKIIDQPISLADMTTFNLKKPIESYANLLARNTLISHVEMQLAQLLVLAGLKDESIEQTRKRLERDSSK